MRVLVVEDERKISTYVKRGLEEQGYAVDTAFTGREALDWAEVAPYDMIILDILLPEIDGLTVCRELRKRNNRTPILMLTARDTVDDRVNGLDAGADDYLVKPFAFKELLARMRALLRRSAGHAKAEIECGALRLDTKTARVTHDGVPIKLTSHEYRLLAYLMHHTGRVVSRTELVEHLYDQDFDRDSNTIEVFIGRLRKKIPTELIHTVRGLGYCLSKDSGAA